MNLHEFTMMSIVVVYLVSVSHYGIGIGCLPSQPHGVRWSARRDPGCGVAVQDAAGRLHHLPRWGRLDPLKLARCAMCIHVSHGPKADMDIV